MYDKAGGAARHEIFVDLHDFSKTWSNDFLSIPKKGGPGCSRQSTLRESRSLGHGIISGFHIPPVQVNPSNMPIEFPAQTLMKVKGKHLLDFLRPAGKQRPNGVPGRILLLCFVDLFLHCGTFFGRIPSVAAGLCTRNV